MILETIEIISTVLYIFVGIISSTKLYIKLKIKIYMNIISTLANSLWLFWCLGIGAYGFIWTAILYVLLGIFSIFNFSRIYKKAKNGKEYKII